MSDQLSVKELMGQCGYRFKSSCHCDGYETWTYKNENMTVKWRKYKYQFQIIRGRTVILNWTKVSELPENLKKLHADVAIPE
jgi:hypothetical protein